MLLIQSAPQSLDVLIYLFVQALSLIFCSPDLSKILEGSIHSQLYKDLNTNDLLSNQQFGFRPHRSTVTAVLNFTDEVLLNMEKGKLCGAAFIDLAKAFDTIDHRILLSKMLKLGISSNALNRPIPLCGRRAMHAGSLVSKLLTRKMAVVRLAVLLGRINDYFLLNPRCDRRCFHRSM